MSSGLPVQRPIGFKPWEISALVNRTVIEQHAEEAAFLWTQRKRAALAPNYSLKDLAKLDGRVEAHVEGLRVAGEIGWEICAGAPEIGPGEVFASAILAFESSDPKRIDSVLEIGCADPVLQAGLISALGWMSVEQASQSCAPLVSAAAAEVRRVGIAGLAVHRLDPGPALSRASDDENSPLRARTLKAVGELGKIDLVGTLISHLSDSDESSRFYAAWSAARLAANSRAAINTLQQIAEGGGHYSERAVDMAVRSMPMEEANAWRMHLGARPETLRLSVIAAAAIGDPGVNDHLIRLMEDPKLARVAGGAFSMITGADLGYEDLDGDAPEEAEGFSEEDQEVGPDPDDGLQWPSPERIARWWSKKSSAFQPGLRFLRGKPINSESLSDTLVHGTQRQRVAAALELAIRNPAQSLFEVRQRGDRQLREVKRWIS